MTSPGTLVACRTIGTAAPGTPSRPTSSTSSQRVPSASETLQPPKAHSRNAVSAGPSLTASQTRRSPSASQHSCDRALPTGVGIS